MVWNYIHVYVYHEKTEYSYMYKEEKSVCNYDPKKRLCLLSNGSLIFTRKKQCILNLRFGTGKRLIRNYQITEVGVETIVSGVTNQIGHSPEDI